mgnify:CR=1 FL=1
MSSSIKSISKGGSGASGGCTAVFDCSDCNYSYQSNEAGSVRMIQRLHRKRCPKTGRTDSTLDDQIIAKQASVLNCHPSQIKRRQIQLEPGDTAARGKIINQSKKIEGMIAKGKSSIQGKGRAKVDFTQRVNEVLEDYAEAPDRGELPGVIAICPQEQEIVFSNLKPKSENTWENLPIEAKRGLLLVMEAQAKHEVREKKTTHQKQTPWSEVVYEKERIKGAYYKQGV